MNFDFSTIAIIWLTCALIAVMRCAKQHRRITMGDVLGHLLFGPFVLLFDAVLWSLERGDKVQLWKREA